MASQSINPFPIRVAQTLGLTTTLFAAGSSFSFSYFVIPRLLESPTSIMLSQWQTTYISGRNTVPPLAAFSSLIWGFLAYHAKTTPAIFREGGMAKVYAYAAAAACSVAMIPYTRLFMHGTNTKLMQRAQQTKTLKAGEKYVEVKGEESSHKLVDWWAVLNLGRTALLCVGGVLGAWTALN